MEIRSPRFSSIAAVLFSILTFAVVLVFIFGTAQRPLTMAAAATKVQQQFSYASSLETLRIYVERLHATQEALWLDPTPASSRAFASARANFERQVAVVVRADVIAHSDSDRLHRVRAAYWRYVRDTLSARHANLPRPPWTVNRDYTSLERIVYTHTMRGFRHALEVQARYQRFTGKVQRSTQLLSLLVAASTLLLLGLAQFYRMRLQRSSDERMALLADAALKDPLTGLRNRRAFEDDLSRAVALALRCNHPISLVLIDVDGFKEINDRLGHAAGDDLLSQVSERLTSLREADCVYRLGGDEFAIILAATNGDGAEVAANRLLTPITSEALQITLSAGVAQLRAGEAQADWRQRADIALYEAKRRGGGTAVLYSNIASQARFVSAQSICRVRELLEHGEMQTAFQPIWDRNSGKILGFEALARPPREHGFAGPHEAFDAAQRIGHIVDLDYLCLRSAVAAAQGSALRSLIFFNMTPATLEHPSFRAASIASMLAEHRIDPSQVVIEITERTIKDLPAIVRNAEQLRAMGIHIALDDVGSGSAGLSLLSALTVDFVKIDRTLLCNGNTAKARAVLTGILAIADAMGAYLIAEGIETQELLDFASTFHEPVREQSVGVRGFQGYLLGRPQVLPPGCDPHAFFSTSAPWCGAHAAQ